MIRVLIVGLGAMGLRHALAYAELDMFRIVGLVNRSDITVLGQLAHLPVESDFHGALARLQPDLVVIATYADSHAAFSIAAMNAGAHVFVGKPLATTLDDCHAVARVARLTGRKLTSR